MNQSIILSNDFLSSTIRKVPVVKNKGIYQSNLRYRDILLIDAKFLYKNFGRVYRYEQNSISSAIKYNNSISHFLSKEFHCLVILNRDIYVLYDNDSQLFEHSTDYDIKTITFDIDIYEGKKYAEFYILDSNDNLHRLIMSGEEHTDEIIDTNVTKLIDYYGGIIFYIKNRKIYGEFYDAETFEIDQIDQMLIDSISNAVKEINTHFNSDISDVNKTQILKFTTDLNFTVINSEGENLNITYDLNTIDMNYIPENISKICESDEYKVYLNYITGKVSILFIDTNNELIIDEISNVLDMNMTLKTIYILTSDRKLHHVKIGNNNYTISDTIISNVISMNENYVIISDSDESSTIKF